MKSATRCALLVLIALTTTVCFFLLPSLRSHAQGCDNPTDLSQPFYNGDCGNIEWDLAASVGGNYYDEGYWWAYGACAGNYFECGGYVQPYTIGGDEQLQAADYDPVNYGWHFYWMLDDWVVQNQTITCQDGSQSTAQSVIDYPYSTPTFWGWCNYE